MSLPVITGVAGVFHNLPLETPSGRNSETQANVSVVDSAYRLVNTAPSNWMPASHNFQIASSDHGAPIGVLAADVAAAESEGRLLAGINQ